MPSGIKANRIRSVLDSGGVALGFGVLSFNADVIEAVGRSGIDFIWLDLEHGGISPYDSVSMGHLVRAIENVGLAAMVRPAENNTAMIAKILDTGVHSILVPGVDTREEAMKVVAAARFKVKGFDSARGAPVARSSAWSAPDVAFSEDSDRQILVGVMIESKEAVENLEEILSVDGLDYVFVGQSDLSVSLGIPFQATNPLLREYVARIRETCQRKGVPLGIIANEPQAVKQAIAEGYKIIRIGMDLPLLSKTLRSLVDAIKT